MEDIKKITMAELEKARKQKKIQEWNMTVLTINRANQYITKNFDTESVLESERIELHVKIHKNLGKHVGDSSFVVVETSTPKIRKQIAEAIGLCRYSKKEKYSLPSKQKLKKKTALADKKIQQGFEKGDIHVKLKRMCDAINKRVQKHKDIKLNGMELLVGSSTKQVVNSKKVNLSQEKTSVYLEMVLTASDKKREMECLPYIRVARLSDIKVNEFVDEKVKLVKDILDSGSSFNFTGQVLLSGGAVREYFMPELTLSPLFVHCGARIKYMGLSRYQPGKKVAKQFKADRITAYTNPLLAYNTSSSNFDEDGVPSLRVKLIDKGIFKNYIASKRFADYMKTKPTGSIGSIELSAGSKSVKQLYKNKNFVEIVEFSSFCPNSVSGDFSAEIRLGYIWKNGKKKAFRGGMFTGNVFKLIEDVYFSKERMNVEGYYGPKAVMFNDCVIAGI
ncbi:metallopeptidase TldD-related protein [Thermoproteota archaeon]